MNSYSKYSLVLKCKHCRSKIVTPKSACKVCGIVESFFVKKTINDNYVALCSICNSQISFSHLPNMCIECGSFEKDLWDASNNDWAKRNIIFYPHTDAIWLIGDFVGDFIGELNSIQTNQKFDNYSDYTRKYNVKITTGKLINYQFTNKQPILEIDNSVIPIRQDLIKGVLVKELNSDMFVQLDLEEVVIYNWTRVSDKEFFDDKVMAGHLSGKFCGCISRDLEINNVDLDQSESETAATPAAATPEILPKISLLFGIPVKS